MGRRVKGRVDDERNVEIGVDLGIVELKLTTAYGNALKVEIAGQEFIWGREGGEINLKVGVFEVNVLAENCVVTETKSIAGQVVMTRSYPDPGCKPPDPPTPTPTPGRGNSPISISGMTSDRLCYVLVDHNVSLSNVYPTSSMTGEGVSKITASNVPDVVPPQGLPPFFSVRADVTTSGTISELMGGNWVVNSGTKQSTNSFSPSSTIFSAGGTATFIRLDVVIPNSVVLTGSGANPAAPAIYPRIIYGKEKEIAAYLSSVNARPDWNASYSNPPYSSHNLQSLKVARIIYVGAAPAKTPLLPTGNKPPMNQDCCDEINDKLDDIMEALHVPFFQKEGFPVPSYLLAPGCNTEQSVKAKNYYHLFQRLFQTIAHTAIVNPDIQIKDADSVKEGDQPASVTYLSATGWAEGVTKLLFEAVDDGNVGTNMDIRTGVAVTQILVALASVSERLDTVMDAIGATTYKDSIEVETTYNLIEPGKGFSKDQQKAIDINEDISTEALLAKLLKTRKNEVVIKKVHPRDKTVIQLLLDLLKRVQ
jgi:hypothetical protein